MAKFVLTDASVDVNAVDLSNRVMSVTLNVNPEIQEASTMGSHRTSQLQT